MKKVGLLLIVVFGAFYSCKTIDKLEFGESLSKMVSRDQEIQNLIMNSGEKDKTKLDSLNLLKSKIFESNYTKVKTIYEVIGYPSISKYGKENSYNYWLLVQHCDNDIVFQEKVLNKMKKLVKKNDVNKKNYAYLYDRVMKNKGMKQYFGTQFTYLPPNYEPTVINIEDSINVNIRRKEIGLEPLEEYIKSMKDILNKR